MSVNLGQDLRLAPPALASIAGAYAGLHCPGDLRQGSAPHVLVGAAIAGLLLLASGRLAPRTDATGQAGRRRRRAARTPLGRAGLAIVLLLPVAAGTAGLALLSAAAVQPAWLVQAAQARESAWLDGYIRGRVEPDGRSHDGSCMADLAVTGIEIGERRVRLGTTRRLAPVLVRAEPVPCDALAGQKISGNARLSPARPEGRVAARARLAKATPTGAGTLHSRIVDGMGRNLHRLLQVRPAHAQGLVPGVALGDDTRVDRELEDAMKLTQLTHLIAVSGGHVSIVTGIALLAIGRRRAPRAAIGGAIALAALVALVGAHASVVRAALMGIVVLGALALRRPSQATAALCGAILAAALADPWLVVSYGFALSAAATAGIVLLGKPMSARLRAWLEALLPQGTHRPYLLLSTATDALAMSLAAQLACTPILLALTDTGSIWGVLANVLVAPVVAPLTVFGLAAAFLAPVAPALASLALLPATASTWWIETVATALAAWPGSGIGARSAALATLAQAILLAASRPRAVERRHLTLALAGFVTIATAGAVYAAHSHKIPANWQVVVCDVGQGSALLARTAAGTVMVDVGPEDGHVESCLKDAGVTRIDLLILSHFHADHVGALERVLGVADVTQAWTTPNHRPEPEADATLGLLEERKIAHADVRRGTDFRAPDGTQAATVLSPGDWLWHDPNADSVVARIEAAGGILVMGDADGDVQTDIARELRPVRTVVVAHHGSARQSPLLARAALPQYAVISVGKNSYGHPSQQALDTYAEAEIYDTLTSGHLVFTDATSAPRTLR